MERWYVMMKKADFSSIGAKYNISPVIARLIRNRDIIEDEEINLYLNGTIADLYDGMLMKDMDKAVEILSEKIREEKPVRVIGDYDIDGVNAAYILKEGLEGLGADVDTDIPDRIKDGYGLNKMLIDRALDDGIDTIITCDNGIAAAEEIAYGRKNGLTVIVTDHHQVPFVEINKEREYLLPQADAVVDPRRPDCEYPFKNLCGAAVALIHGPRTNPRSYVFKYSGLIPVHSISAFNPSFFVRLSISSPCFTKIRFSPFSAITSPTVAIATFSIR